MKVVKVYDCCPEPYSSVAVTLQLRRRSAILQMFQIHFPLLWIVVVALLTFCIPHERVEVRIVAGSLGNQNSRLSSRISMNSIVRKNPWKNSTHFLLFEISLLDRLNYGRCPTCMWSRMVSISFPPTSILHDLALILREHDRRAVCVDCHQLHSNGTSRE